MLGLALLRESLPYRVVTTAWIRDALLEHDAVFARLAPAIGCVGLDEPFALDREGRLEAKLFPVVGKLPAHLQELPHSSEATLAVRVTARETDLRLVDAPRLGALDEGTLAELQAADLRFVDGSFFSPNELLGLRPGAADAWEMGHVPISGDAGSLGRLRLMGGRSFYTHLHHTNPLVDPDSKEALLVQEAGVEIARDGMDLTI